MGPVQLAGQLGGKRDVSRQRSQPKLGHFACSVIGSWPDAYVRTDPLEKLKVPTIPRTIVETFTTDQMVDPLAAAPAPLALTLRIFLDTGVRLGEATVLRIVRRRPGPAEGAEVRAATSGPSPTGRTLDAALGRYLDSRAAEQPDFALAIRFSWAAMAGH